MFVNENGDIDAEEKEPTPTTIFRGSDKSQDSTALTTWVFENNSFVPQAKIVGDKTYSIVCDYLGTPVQVFNEKGENVWECELDIYGNICNIGGSKTFIPFRYQGQYEDVETGLYYNRFRYYSPLQSNKKCYHKPKNIQTHFTK
ncbi:RHS repeat domain-containing protein [Algibacter sp. L3A6]|uniref:RHS repeat domain-containing protein n=1 Tax=Algibacter sp. L3A6 TaxID=2686366 RepID=UPI0018EF3086|nr:RHS repeat-associated core domain-containing protein [Algibacter sp. L3A6]